MPLPSLPEFHELLSGIRLSAAKAAGENASVQIPFLPAVDETGLVDQRELWLHYPTQTKLPLNRLLERINKELHAAHHSRHDDFALFALALATLLPAHRGELLARLNMIFDAICGAEVVLYHILSVEFPAQYQFEIPPFAIGPLRTQKLAYNCQKAQSDFYVRYRDNLANAWTIERRPLSVSVFDIPRIRNEIFGAPIDQIARADWELLAWESIIDGYFSLQNTVLFEQFQAEIVSAQSPLLAIGSPFFDPRPLQLLSGVFRTHRVAVFLNLGSENGGFVAPGGTGPILINLAGINERVPLLLKDLKESYGFERFDDSPLHQTIKIYADFVARGRRHEIDSRFSEALLHYIIALELIFGDRQAIQRSVSERVALITYRQSGRSFEEQQHWINQIYDLRSRYVHEGKELTDEPQLHQLRNLSEHVFRSLMSLQRAHTARSSRGKETLTEWLRELDYLAKGLIAGKEPTETQLAEAFIA